MTWRYLEENNVSAAYGLATDEYLMNTRSGDAAQHTTTLRLYTYQDHCALVGRFQNIHAELDLDNCRHEGFPFSRRLTGGGAIIMGQGQLGLCLATANTFGSSTTRELYHIFSAPILKAFEKLGIQAAFKGKNDLEVNGKKIAGLGIYVNPHGTIQFHASILAELDIAVMLRMLKIPVQKLGDKAYAGVEQRMTTASKETGRKVSVDELRHIVKKEFETHFNISFSNGPVVSEEYHEIEKLEKERYGHEDWIFLHSPQADMTGMGICKTSAGLLRAYVALKGEIIKSLLITGDFFEHEDLLRQIENRLKWSPLDKGHVEQVVSETFKMNGRVSSGMFPTDVTNVIWRAALGAVKETRYTYQGACFA